MISYTYFIYFYIHRETIINFSDNKWMTSKNKANAQLADGKAKITMNKHKDAIKSFSIAVDILQNSTFENRKEEEEQIELLCTLYSELATCYNIANIPKKACIACNEYAKLRNIHKNLHMLVENAKALLKLGNFRPAEKKLLKALKLEPDNENVKKELKLAKDKKIRFDNHRALISKISNRAPVVESEDTETENDASDNSQSISNDFIILVQDKCESILNDTSIVRYRYEIPAGLSTLEIEAIKLICISYGISVVEEGGECDHIDLIKPKTN
jgi:tetratricopeptide (TPR) repeat protein